MRFTVLIILLLTTSIAQALEFRSYTNSEGVTVLSNVPKNCVKNSVMTCLQYHPVISSGPSSSTPGGAAHAKPPAAATAAGGPGRASSATGRHNARPPTTATSNLQMDTLERIAEMYGIINEYFPGYSDSQAATDARAEQENILGVLQTIRGLASSDDQPTIERAIDILRANLVE